MSASDTCPHCGCEINDKRKKMRSYPQLKRYFALLKAALAHWPEQYDYQFTSVDELRSYLQMKAGYREVGAQIPLVGLNAGRAKMLAEAAIRATKSYAIPVLHGDTLVIFRPKSISFSKLPHHEACRLFADVESAIEQIIGVSADQLLDMEANAA